MPEIGETIILFKKKRIWIKCLGCGKEYWISFASYKKPNYSGLCGICARRFRNSIRSPNWKGGRSKEKKSGYVKIYLFSDDPFYSMVFKDKRRDPTGMSGGYVSEHRLVMARHLNRCLEPWEIVHHINGIRDDNKIENLELLPGKSAHEPSMKLTQYINKIEKENQSLNQKNQFLNNRIEQLEDLILGITPSYYENKTRKEKQWLEKQEDQQRKLLNPLWKNSKE